MSQRRAGSASKKPTTTTVMVPPQQQRQQEQHDTHHERTIQRQVQALALEEHDEEDTAALTDNANTNNNDEEEGWTMEERYQRAHHAARVQHWKQSPFAVGLVERTWMEERHKHSWTTTNYGDDECQADETGCLCCSAHVCPYLNAGRVGNMIVLKSTTEWVEHVEHEDNDHSEEEEEEEVEDETGGFRKVLSRTKVTRYSRPKLQCVVGPYWPMMVFVTYPLILGVSAAALWKLSHGKQPTIVVLLWTVGTVGLIVALAFTACCDPGIHYKVLEPPPQEENQYRWTDRAYSYRHKNSYYDVDTGKKHPMCDG